MKLQARKLTGIKEMQLKTSLLVNGEELSGRLVVFLGQGQGPNPVRQGVLKRRYKTV